MEAHYVKKFHLIPQVRELKRLDGCLEASGIGWIGVRSMDEDYTLAARYLQGLFLKIAGVELPVEVGGRLDGGAKSIDFGVDSGINANPEYYRLTVTPDGVEVRAASPQGLFRAAATLAQLLLSEPGRDVIPCVDIVDWPDFPARGFYRDVTRGRVPTLDSLKRLADTLAFYKINQLQLYVEHAFAFSMIPEFSEGNTPLAAADIVELDKYCADRFIDLVPSLSTFGHLYELLRLPRFERLNELDVKASETPRDLWDRMAHYTLNVSDPGSMELVKGMIGEYAPLFSSKRFNICCDETFDLGKGKNAERARSEGVGRLYVEFVNKVIDAVKSVGKEPMLWGDIVLKHPEYISELPGGTVFLNWDYAPDAGDESVKKFRDAGVAQYVCPGVQGWSRFAADVDRACANISRMARFGVEAGAVGVLNTDWGDCGHVNLPATSCHGLAFGAALSWNAGDGADSGDFDGRFSLLQWGISGGDGLRLGKMLRELGGFSGYHFGNLYAWVIGKQCLWYKEEDVKAADWRELSAKAARAGEIKEEFAAMAGKARGIFEAARRNRVDTAEFEEYVWSAAATEWLLSLLIAKKKYEYGQDVGTVSVDAVRLIEDGKTLLSRFKTLWLARAQESELRDVVETFEKVFARISEISNPH
jgi:hypothetical protein